MCRLEVMAPTVAHCVWRPGRADVRGMLPFGLSRSAQADREPQGSAPRGPRFALGRPGGET